MKEVQLSCRYQQVELQMGMTIKGKEQSIKETKMNEDAMRYRNEEGALQANSIDIPSAQKEIVRLQVHLPVPSCLSFLFSIDALHEQQDAMLDPGLPDDLAARESLQQARLCAGGFEEVASRSQKAGESCGGY